MYFEIYLIFCVSIYNLFTCYQYEVKKDINVNSSINQVWFIQSFKIADKLKCLAKCNLNDECLTATFIRTNKSDNCVLYRRYFSQIELIPSTGRNIYEKKCN